LNYTFPTANAMMILLLVNNNYEIIIATIPLPNPVVSHRLVTMLYFKWHGLFV